jgi:hypothetical protein
MTTLTYKHSISLLSLISYIVISVAIPSFLLYLDEGRCNFEWVKDPYGLKFCATFVIFIFLGLLVSHYFFFKAHFGLTKIALTLIIGVPLGIGVLVSLVGLFATISMLLLK